MAEKKVTILVVEDSLIILHMSKILLGQIGYEVTTADNGQTATRIIAEQKFDLITSDMQMPIMNGMNFLKVVRKSKLNNQTPFIFWNSDQGEEFKKEAIANGANGFIPKPATLKEIQKAIAEIFEQ